MRRFAFTLIELIVVIAVVASLMALTVQGVHRVRAQGKAMVCQARQRELLLGFIQYDGEHQTLPFGMNSDPGVLPPGGVAGTSLDSFAWWWFHYLGYRTPDVINPTTALMCPAKRLESLALQANVLWGNYGVNWSLCRSPLSSSILKNARAKAPYRLSTIKSPVQTMLIMDSGYAVINWYHAALSPPQKVFLENMKWASYVPGLSINRSPEKYLLEVQKTDAIEGRHPGQTVNTGFVDGHIDRIIAETTLVDKSGDTYFKVKPFWDPLWNKSD
jgi:prepilin-type N-terminal cleavage/methylation domain-containing protein/prepilin-type processing-associated H-X9-DG protein